MSKDGIPTYITALLYEPLNTNRTNITIDGEEYENQQMESGKIKMER